MLAELSFTVFKGHPLWTGRAKMDDEEVVSLHQLVLDHSNVSNILEIGSLNGFSTVNLALALEQSTRKGTITAIDIFREQNDRHDEAWFDENCKNFGVSHRVRKIKGHSQDRNVVKRFKKERFDLIFHDASHTYFGVMPDILVYEPLLSLGGFIAFHDYKKEWTLKKAVDEYFLDNRNFQFTFLVNTLICFQKVGEKSGLSNYLHYLKLKHLQLRGHVVAIAKKVGALKQQP